MIDPTGLMGSKPGEPDEDDLYPANKGQWQANPGACDKCSKLDGNYYSPGSEPEKPHPNCKCEVVACYYGVDQGDWKEYSRSEVSYDMPTPVFIYPWMTVPVLWTKSYWVKEKRQDKQFILCGSRKDIRDTDTEFRKRKVKETKYSNAHCVSTGVIDQCSNW